MIEFKNLHIWVRNCLSQPHKYKSVHGFVVEMIPIEQQVEEDPEIYFYNCSPAEATTKFIEAFNSYLNSEN